MFEDILLCGECHSEMEQLEGFLTFYCPYCLGKAGAVDSLLNDPEIGLDKEARDHLLMIKARL